MSEITFDHAQIGGVRLHYAKAGQGEQLVILLHGFPEFWYSWRYQLASLSDRYTVVAPDLRGYNLSDKPVAAADYALENLTDDAIGLINHFGREKAAVVGHDWGALVAWHMAEHHPETVWKVAALQVPPMSVSQKNMTFKQAAALSYMLFFLIPRLPEWFFSRNDFLSLTKLMRRAAAERDFFEESDLNEYRKSWREPFALTSALNYYRVNFFRHFLRPHPEIRINVPALFIYGEKEPAIMPETVRNIASAVDAPYSEVRIPDAGHWVQQEASEAVTDALREFLAE